MSRGVQKTDEERLQLLEQEIAELESRKSRIEEKIKGLNERKQEVLEREHQKKLEELQSFIGSLGKSPEEILSILKTAG